LFSNYLRNKGRKVKKLADIFSIGAQFIDYCQKKGWIIEKGAGKNKEFFVSEEGIKELNKFNIEV